MWKSALLPMLAQADDSVASPTSDDGSVEADVSNAWETVDRLVSGFVERIPQLVIAAFVFLLFVLAAWIVKKVVHRKTGDPSASNLAEVLGRIAQWVIWIVGLMVAVAIVAPTVTPAKLLSALGIGGVAIGFAFKDILQNFLAGILILLRQPFEVGDQVVFGDHEGTVESIDTRSTILKTYDGRRILIPNGQVYTNPMVVLTAHPARRSEYDVGIGYADDIGKAAQKMLEVMSATDGVLSEPSPDVLVVALAGSTVNLRARWWTDPERKAVVQASSEVIRGIKQAMDAESIDMPYPTQVVLFHDQTEEVDGDRTSQREGWPAGESPPRPRYRVQQGESGE